MAILAAQGSRRWGTSWFSGREPAYPLGPRFAGPRQGLARGSAPSIPKDARAPLRCACSPIVRAVSGRARWSLAQAAPLALNGACRRGPRSPPRHRRSPRPHRRRAGVRHDGEVVLGERTGDAVRDGGTHRSLPRQRRGKLGVQGGRSVPARPQCFRRLAQWRVTGFASAPSSVAATS